MARFRELNPEFGFHLHGEEVLLHAFRYAYKRIEGPHLYARRSDLLRVSAMLRYGGGWYFDCDFLPIRPMRELYAAYTNFPRGCFVTHCDYLRGRPWIANGIIGTAPDSPFFALYVAGLVYRGDCERDLRWDSYGPGLMTPLVEQYSSLVHIGELDGFYRLTDRKDAMPAYRRIAADNYSHASMVRELGEPLPYMLHQGMQDQVDL